MTVSIYTSMVIISMNSLPLPLSFFFCRPLPSGGFSSLGGTIGNEDLEPLKVVAIDGREWGVDCSGTIIEEGEELDAIG